MIIEAVSLRIAEGIKRQVPEHKSSVNVLKHAISIVLNVVLIVAATLIVSLFTGNTKEAAIALVSFALLRQFSGGLHLKTGISCVLVTTALFTAISYIDLSVMYLQILNALSLLLVLIYVPCKIEKQSRIPKKYYPVLRVICAVMVLASMLIQSPTLAVTFFVQALSLIHRKEVRDHVTD
ncbi:accessory gene regulator B family protein [Paenibacillus cineris]|uniref:Accessory gene regulator B n=1 Tax=Paenibacillus cineris TaxID=237530 RepID=A0ABQ4LN51_9BACL|nr:accessory gene regulator B family protein [Paenibacillus cineris]GIO57949.1 hypothetical protein J21TS7_62670 [Paenibacillus cineris]